MLTITRLLSLLAAFIAAGGVKDFQSPGRRADNALASHLSRWRCDGVAVEEPELREERRGEGRNTASQGGGLHKSTPALVWLEWYWSS